MYVICYTELCTVLYDENKSEIKYVLIVKKLRYSIFI